MTTTQAPPGVAEARPAPAPWHHTAWRVVVALVAVAVLGFGLGTFAASRDDAPGPASVDVRFLQEMRRHHDQATEMALIEAQHPDADPLLHTIAIEILLGQQLESGLMVQMLRTWHRQEQADDTGALMPGMATDAQMAELRAATGVARDRLFAQLMIAHHEGGIGMADDAVARADDDGVVQLARGMVKAQEGDLVELRRALAALPAA